LAERERNGQAGVLHYSTRTFPEGMGIARLNSTCCRVNKVRYCGGFEHGSNREIIQFLYRAKVSAGVVRSQLYVALDLEYVDHQQFDDGLNLCLQTSTRINDFIEYLKETDFKGHKFHESQVEYQV
jgi:23S rRNA-intervening sequence protein